MRTLELSLSIGSYPNSYVWSASIKHSQQGKVINLTHNQLTLIIGDLECLDVACQVLLHLVFLIPTQRRVGMSKNSGEG
jgi:hypothetical protein